MAKEVTKQAAASGDALNTTPEMMDAIQSVAAKYRDPVTGQTWTGRGKAPKWIDGKDRNQFVIA